MESAVAQKKIDHVLKHLDGLLDMLDSWVYDDEIPSYVRQEINGEFNKLYSLVEEFKNPTYRLVVDLDERGEFRATVYSNLKEIEIFSYRIGACYPEEQGAYLIDDGFMKHARDTKGLTSYLRNVDIIEQNAVVK
jgi:hypothetical protein